MSGTLSPTRSTTTYEDIRSCTGPLEEKIWYHGSLSRDGAVEKLTKAGSHSLPREGYFLIRRGSSGLVLSVLEGGAVRNYRISEQIRGGVTCFNIDDGPRFPTVANLVEFYRTAKTGTLPIKLRGHCPNKDLSSPHFEFGRYGVAWLATSGQKEEEVVAEAAVAAETYKKELIELEVERPRMLTNKFAAAARAVVAAKRLHWQTRSKKIHDSVRPEDILPEGPENPQTRRFNRLHQTFRKSAAVESKLHLDWLNGKLRDAGLSEVDNLRRSMRSGVVIINLLHSLTNRPKPMHAENPNSEIQMKDNWHAAVHFMQKANIPTYDLESQDLFNIDQRSMLKLFSILMKWDADNSASAAEP